MYFLTVLGAVVLVVGLLLTLLFSLELAVRLRMQRHNAQARTEKRLKLAPYAYIDNLEPVNFEDTVEEVPDAR